LALMSQSTGVSMLAGTPQGVRRADSRGPAMGRSRFWRRMSRPEARSPEAWSHQAGGKGLRVAELAELAAWCDNGVVAPGRRRRARNGRPQSLVVSAAPCPAGRCGLRSRGVTANPEEARSSSAAFSPFPLRPGVAAGRQSRGTSQCLVPSARLPSKPPIDGTT
jgi:hypothetical protein